MSKGNIVIGALAGIAAGAVLGLLLAPEKGTKTRKKITKKSAESVEELRDRFNEILTTANKKLEAAQSGIHTMYSKKKNISL